MATVVVKACSTVKDLAVAHAFGRNDNLDSFLFALVLPAFALNLVVGSVSSALVPVLVETRQKVGAAASQRLLSSVTLLTGAALVAVALALTLLARLYLPYMAHSFSASKQLLTREFLYLLTPWLVLSGLATFLACVLNAVEKFAVPALVPILTPLAVLLCIAVWARPDSGYALVLGTVAGSLLEFIFFYYLVKKNQLLGALQWQGVGPPVRAVVSQTAPMMAGCLLMGATPVVDQIMAAMLGPGSVAALSYGSKITMGMLAIGATALSTATLPYFSQMAASADWDGCRHTLKRYSALVFLVTIPVTALLIGFSTPLVRLLFQRGAFTHVDTEIVSRVQVFYCLQVPFYVASMLFVRFISSIRRNDLLMFAAAINLVVDIVMNLVLMHWLGIAGIALSTSIVAAISFFFLLACSLKLMSQGALGMLPTKPLLTIPE
ncbi:MAG TPA: lipid II flippase MurJ [Candidatus Angelobacter sp.]|nr:lipid II flippase MurJ [Candidatus Angelobacter sp.]